MPSNSNASQDTIGIVDAALQSKLRARGNIDKQVIASSKRVLLHSITFVPSRKPHGIELNALKTKYIQLSSASRSSAGRPTQITAGPPPKSPVMKEHNNSLPSPKVIIYPESKLSLEWKRSRGIGCGLANLGNTCFLNSTLQCLCYTPPLANYCLSAEHDNVCRRMGFCMMCELQRHLRRTTQNSAHAVRPESIINKLHLICKTFQRGRQEDAHEFLRYVIDHMQKATMTAHPKLDRFSKATTVIDQIFGGYLRSQVQCLECKERFNTYDPFMDVGLDIKNCDGIESSLSRYVRPEILQMDNAYMCPTCRKKVKAMKLFTIHKPSNILTLQLKRFDHTKMFSKITRHVSFPDHLNIRPYMSDKQGDHVMYNLYGVLVHSGCSIHMGHYYCFVKSPTGSWHVMNDAMVQQVSAGRVHTAEAYLLFYVKKNLSVSKARPPQHNPSATIVGPKVQQSTEVSNGPKLLNGIIRPNELGVLIPRKPNITSPQKNPSPVKSQSKISIKTVQDHRISFGIRPKPIGQEQPTVRYTQSLLNGLGAKHVTNKPNMSGDSSNKKRLVPYNADSDDETNRDKSSTKKSNSLVDNKVNDQNDKVCVVNKKISASKISSDVHFDTKLNATQTVPGDSRLLTQQKRIQLTKPLPFHPTIHKNVDNVNKIVIKSSDVVKSDVLLEPYAEMLKTNKTEFVPRQVKKDKVKVETTGVERTVCKENVSNVKQENTHIRFNDDGESMADKIPTEINGKTFVADVPNKRPRLDGLICSTSPQKINASSHWLVQHQDCIKSPSISSNCSNTSVNSTCEWQVSDADAKKKKKRKFTNENPLGDVVYEHSASSHPLSDSVIEDINVSLQDHKRGEKRKFSMEKNTDDVEKNLDIIKKIVNEKLKKDWRDDEEIEENMKVSISERLKEIAETNQSDPVIKNKHEHIEKVSHKQKNHVTLLDKVFHRKKLDVEYKPLIETDTSDSSCKKHKKHKKHKNKDHETSEITENQTKINKKRDRKSSESAEEKLSSKKKQVDLKRKRNRSDSESSGEYQWVERTDFSSSCADNSDDTRRTEAMNGHKSSRQSPTKSVSVKKWDAYVDRNQVRNNFDDDDEKSDLIRELETMSSVHGFGKSVESWDGGHSKVDEDVAKDRRRNYIWYDDGYDEELDRGRLKKVKKPKMPELDAGNQFQRVYDQRRENKVMNFHFSRKGHSTFKPKSSSPHYKERKF